MSVWLRSQRRMRDMRRTIAGTGPSDLQDQLVPGAVDRDDVSWFGGVLFDLLAQLDHEVVDAAGGRVAGDAPDLVQDLVARDRLAGALVEEADQLDLVEGQRHGLA